MLSCCPAWSLVPGQSEVRRTLWGYLGAVFVEYGAKLQIEMCSGCCVVVEVSNSGSGMVIVWWLFVVYVIFNMSLMLGKGCVSRNVSRWRRLNVQVCSVKEKIRYPSRLRVQSNELIVDAKHAMRDRVAELGNWAAIDACQRDVERRRGRGEEVLWYDALLRRY